jgi:hypothetical protein
MLRRSLPLVLLAALLSACSFPSPLGIVNTCSESAQLGCLSTSTSPAWWLR